MRLTLLLLALVPQTCLQAQERSQALYVLQIQPGPPVEALYHEVERCAGRLGDFQGLEWYVTAHLIVSPTGERTWGWWRRAPDGRRQVVLIAGDSTELRHEILHDVLWVSGWRPSGPDDDGHPKPWFGRCAQR